MTSRDYATQRLVPCASFLEPAGNLGEPACHLKLPIETCGTCPDYEPGINDAERVRGETWASVVAKRRRTIVARFPPYQGA
jgi:hypothetical protein